jgi:hypothetical protein
MVVAYGTSSSRLECGSPWMPSRCAKYDEYPRSLGFE